MTRLLAGLRAAEMQGRSVQQVVGFQLCIPMGNAGAHEWRGCRIVQASDLSARIVWPSHRQEGSA